MMLWLMMTALCSAAAVAVSVPLVRRYDDFRALAQDAAIYQDQLKEIDHDLASGNIDAAEANSARAEIQRRIGAAATSAQAKTPLTNGWRTAALVATAGVVILGGVGLYGSMGSPDVQSAQTNGAGTAVAPAQDPIDSAIPKLQAKLAASPNDAEGWRMLGWALFNKQKYAESGDAYAKALALVPDNLDYKSAYAEALVQAAGGQVTPKAQGLFAEVLAKDAKEFRARFYDALALEQGGNQSGALDKWLTLLADSPADAGWRGDVMGRIMALGKATGRDVSAALKPMAGGGTAEQNAAVQAMAPTDQVAMIKGMVAKLADKMAANPGDADGWVKLIKSYSVLKDEAAAKDALAKARAGLANDAAGKAKIDAAAAELGLN